MALETIDRRMSALERRTDKLEAKVGEMDTGFGESFLQNRRDIIELRIGNRRMMELLGAAPVSPDEVDAVLEEQS